MRSERLIPMACRQAAVVTLTLVAAGYLSLENLAAAPAIAPQPTDSQVAKAVVKLLTEKQISRPPLNDDISRRAFDNLFERLDAMKLYFTQADIDEFTKERDGLDDQLRAGSVSFAYQVHQRFLERIDEAVKLVDELLKEEHDFTVREEMVTDSKLVKYARDGKETRDRWRKRLKYELLMLKGDKTEGQAAINRLIRNYYNFAERMRHTEAEELLEIYLSAVAAAFDPSSHYNSETTRPNSQINLALNLEGIGAGLKIVDGDVMVTQVMAGSTAEKHGKLKAGDKVISVAQGNGGEKVDVRELRLNDVVKLIRGKAGTVVRLGVIPKDTNQTVYYNIKREKLELKEHAARGIILEESEKANGIPYRIGVIHVPSIYLDLEAKSRGEVNYKSCTRDVQNILNDFNEKKVDVVLLDLRTIGAGRLEEATSLTGLFIDKGPIAQIKGYDGRVQGYHDTNAGMAWTGPLVVLCSKSSTAIGEALIGAVQDYRRGLIIGDDSTSGRGTFQAVLEVGPQVENVGDPPKLGILWVSTHQLYRPAGDTTQHRGVVPDLVLPSIRNSKPGNSESELKHSVEFDRVPPMNFEKLSLVSENIVKKLKLASEERRGASAEFANVLKEIEQHQASTGRKSVSLRELEFFAQRAELEAETQAPNPESSKTAEVVKRDFYLNEVLAIATDYASLLRSPKAALPKHVPPKMLSPADKDAAQRALVADQERLVKEKQAVKDKAEGWRTWTSTAGTKTEAKFKGMVGQKVRLEKRDGTIITVPSDRLSEEDLAWIRGRK